MNNQLEMKGNLIRLSIAINDYESLLQMGVFENMSNNIPMEAGMIQ